MPRENLPHSLELLFAERPETFVLDNGLTVVHQHLSAQPVVSAQVWVKTGSIHEQEHPGSGLSHFLEHMLFKGTGRRGPGQIAEEVQAFGGKINAYTAFDRTVYYIDGPSESLDSILDILSDQTLNAALPESELAKEKDVILREIDMTLDDPDRIVSRALFSTAYRNSPLQYPVIGIRSLFEHISGKQLSRYYKARYQPNNMVLSIAGDYDPTSLMDQVQKAFGCYPRGTLQPVFVVEEPLQLAHRESRRYGDYQIAKGLMGFKVPAMRHDDAPSLDILASVIGSGYSGRLRQRLREELELVHGISASIWNPIQPGMFFISFQSEPDKAISAESAIMEFCMDLFRKGFTEEELEKARRFALVSEIHARTSVSGLAGRLGLVTAIVGDTHYPQRYFSRIYSTTTESLRELAGRTFEQSLLTVSTLLPESSRPVSARPVHVKEPQAFKEKTLSNGARLLWQEDRRLPRVWMRIAGLAGPLFEELSERGSTSLMTTLLNRDTQFASASEIAGQLESKGGFMMDASGNNTFALALEIMPENIEEGIETLENAILHPAFREETLVRERSAQAAHVLEMQDEILDFGKLALRRYFFGNHPFSVHPYGSLDTINMLGQRQIKAMYDKLIVGGNAVMVIAGDFEESAVIPRVEQFLAKLSPAELVHPDHDEVFPCRSGLVTEHIEREQAVLFQAFPDVGIVPDSGYAAEILDEILSDMSGPLFKAVREDESLAYFVGSSRLLGQRFGCFYLYAGTHPDCTTKVLDIFNDQINRLRAGDISKEAFNSARTRLKVANRFSLQNPANRAMKVSLNTLYAKPPMAWLHYEKHLEAVTIEDLVAFANNQLNPENSLRLVITPK